MTIKIQFTTAGPRPRCSLCGGTRATHAPPLVRGDQTTRPCLVRRGGWDRADGRAVPRPPVFHKTHRYTP